MSRLRPVPLPAILGEISMSIEALNWAWSVPDVSPAQKLVLLALANYADERGRCWPSIRTVSDRTCLARRTVSRALETLGKVGLVKVDRRNRDDGSQSSNIYQLPVKKGCQPDTGGCQSDMGGGRGDMPRGVTVTHHEPSLEPSRNNNSEIQEIVDHYRSKHPRRGRQLRPGHADWKRIASRIKEGFSVADLKKAIDGNLMDQWHRQHAAGHTIEYIFRNTTKVEQFIELADRVKPAPAADNRQARLVRLGALHGFGTPMRQDILALSRWDMGTIEKGMEHLASQGESAWPVLVAKLKGDIDGNTAT